MRFTRLLVFCLLAFASLGCTGQKARDNVAVPALVMASDGVQADTVAGIATLPAADQPAATLQSTAFFDAVRSKDRANISSTAMTAWPMVKTWASSGISTRQATGVIGPNGAALARERLINYEAVLFKAAAPK